MAPSLCEIIGATEQLEILIMPSLDRQTHLHGKGTMLREMCCVAQVKEEQYTHFRNYKDNRARLDIMAYSKEVPC